MITPMMYASGIVGEQTCPRLQKAKLSITTPVSLFIVAPSWGCCSVMDAVAVQLVAFLAQAVHGSVASSLLVVGTHSELQINMSILLRWRLHTFALHSLHNHFSTVVDHQRWIRHALYNVCSFFHINLVANKVNLVVPRYPVQSRWMDGKTDKCVLEMQLRGTLLT